MILLHSLSPMFCVHLNHESCVCGTCYCDTNRRKNPLSKTNSNESRHASDVCPPPTLFSRKMSNSIWNKLPALPLAFDLVRIVRFIRFETDREHRRTCGWCGSILGTHRHTIITNPFNTKLKTEVATSFRKEPTPNTHSHFACIETRPPVSRRLTVSSDAMPQAPLRESRVLAPLSSNIIPPEENDPQSAPNNRAAAGFALSSQELFLVFVKVIFVYIKTTNDRNLHRKAATVVSECTRGNRRGDPQYTPLQEAVEQRLRDSLGLVHFTRAKLCFDSYCAMRRIRMANSNTLTSPWDSQWPVFFSSNDACFY